MTIPVIQAARVRDLLSEHFARRESSSVFERAKQFRKKVFRLQGRTWPVAEPHRERCNAWQVLFPSNARRFPRVARMRSRGKERQRERETPRKTRAARDAAAN